MGPVVVRLAENVGWHWRLARQCLGTFDAD
jgi:hypothetical protein